MGLKRYLHRYDAVYGVTNIWLNTYYSVSKNSPMVTNSLIWTVIYNCLE